MAGIPQAQKDDLTAKALALSEAIALLPVEAPLPPPPPPPPAPLGTVTDLRVTGVAATVVTLTFTEVPDGLGGTADYALRYAVSPLAWGAAGATEILVSGGLTVGALRSVTVSGLTPGTVYQFQVVAYRGTLNVNALFGGLSNIASATTVATAPPPPTGWPNEPAGMRLVSDWGFDQDPPTSGDVPIGTSGWKIVSQAAPGSSRGWTQRVVDPAAPFSPSNVYDFVYPQGMVEGNAPSTVYHDGLGATEVYVGFWWKASSPFDMGPNGNKIAFLFNGGGGAGGQQFMILSPDGKLHVLPEYPGDFRWRDPNVTATPVTLGVWHRLEWYATRAGTLKWWLDGVLQGSYTNVTNAFNFDMFQFSPTWGGNIGAQKRETDHYWFDHVRLSVR